MLKRNVFIICAAFFLAVFAATAHAQLPQTAAGLGYLGSAQNPDGTWDSAASPVETTAATLAVLDTLKALNQTAGTSYTTGLSWLQAQSPQLVDYLSERAHVLNLTDVGTLVGAADSARGGWGGDAGYETNNLDTILALQALRGGNYGSSPLLYASLAYLTGGQNSDGGWGFYRGDASSVYLTALISGALQQFPQMTTIATAVNKASAYLAAHQNADGGFGNSPSTVHDTALAYTALVAVSTDSTVLKGAVDYLSATQGADGSWNDDPYATALALKALHLYEQKPPPPPPPAAGGRLTGTVLDSATGQRLNGVAVVLESNPLINTYSDAFGNFSLEDVPAGSQKVNLAFKDYQGTSASAEVTEGSVMSLGTIRMISGYSTGNIAGTIFDPSGHPLSGVAIAVSGSWSGSAVTGADGTFLFTYVTPGEVTIAATKAGYQPISAAGTVFARTTLSIFPRMTTSPASGSTGRLVGRVVDASLGLPIDHLPEDRGVYVDLSGGISVEPDPDNGGNFAIEGLAPNTYQVTVGMNGYATQTFRVVILPGVTTDLGTVRLSWSFAMTLIGRVTDATTGTPIPGAEVAVAGTNLAGRTDFAGSYVLSNIDYPQFTLKASATGYNAKSFIVGSAPWTQTMDIALTPQVTTGSLTGAVYDVATGQPLGGVALTLVADPSVTSTTDAGGAFRFNAIPKDGQEIKMALSGYVTRSFTTKIVAGVENKVGRIGLSTTPLPASVQGTVWDAVANAPFAGVDIEVTGTGYWHTLTAADGSYQVDNVTPGTVTAAATGGPKPGYFGARFVGNLSPGGVMIFSPALSQTPPPGILKGTVTDLADSHAIQGATIMMSPAIAGVDPAFSDLSGAFTLSGIPVGTYNVSISAPGYTTQRVNVDIISGYLGETTIGVQLEKLGTSTTIAGKVTDGTTGNPVADATVSIEGSTLSMTTGPDGAYTISGISAMEFVIQVSAAGYDPLNYGVKTGSYGNYSVNLRVNKVGVTSSRIYGSVRDAASGTPIAGAEVSLVGMGISALTAADGTYSIAGVTEMVMNLKASAAGYDSKLAPLMLSAYGEYDVSFALGASRASSFAVKSLAADKPSYNANEPVTFSAEIENTGDAAAELTVSAEVTDQYDNVVALIPLPGNPLALGPHAVQTVTLPWDTGQNPPGPYRIALSLTDHLQGGLLAEGRTTLAVEPTASVDGLVSLVAPKFLNVAATATVNLTAYLTNRSNSDAALSAQYRIDAPDGTILSQGTVDFSLAASEGSKVLPLTDFTTTFVKSGQYPVSVKVLSGASLIAQTSDAIYVAPAIRIQSSESLVPAVVVPDGDKDVRINIQIKGVEGLQ